MKLGIRSRLMLGFGTLVAMLALAVAGAAWESSGASAGSKRQAEMASDLGVGARLGKEMLLVRMAVKDYLITNSADDEKRFRDRFSEVKHTMDEAKASFQDQERHEAVDAIDSDIKQYQDAFEGAKDAIITRNTVLSQQAKTGEEAIEIVREVLDDESVFTKDGAAAHGVEAVKNILLGRLQAHKFTTTSDKQDLKGSNQLIVAAIDDLRQLDAAVEDPEHRERIEAAIALLNTYLDLSQTIERAVDARNEFVLTKLDVIGPRIAGNTQFIIDSLIEDNDAVAAETQSMLTTASTVVTGVGVLGIVVGVGVAFVIARLIVQPVSELSVVADKMAQGDFTVTVKWKSSDELGTLAANFNEVIRQNREALCGIRDATNKVGRFASEATKTSGRVSENASSQQQETSRVASAVEEMASSISEVAQKSSQLTDTARKSGNQAKSGGDVVTNTITEINAIADEVSQTKSAIVKLGEKGEKISEIIAVIDDIADQTNLLALNAAIEAARAGEHGRGFAVVADEVRKLAERTQIATEDVAKSIREIQTDTDSAVKLIERSDERTNRGVEMASTAGEALRTIVQDSESLLALIESIATAVEEQSSVGSELARAVDGIRAMAEEIAAAAEQSANGSVELAGASGDLGSLVGRFTI